MMVSCDLKGKRTAVVGVGISNRPLIDFLLRHGAVVTVRDIKPRELLGSFADELHAKGVELICGDGYLENITEEMLFRSPGVRYDKPELTEAVRRGAQLTSEMELFFELCPAHIIGVTGSDGKSTTTTLIAKILAASGKNVYLGGNIGIPLLPEVEHMTEDDYAVVELSSFQLHTMRCSPEIAVITNVSPNHLDYHTDMREYVLAKRNIYHWRMGSRVVLNYGNEITRDMAADAFGHEIVFFGCESGVHVSDGWICCQNENGNEKIIDTAEIRIPGRHNVENYMAAVGALYGIADIAAMREVARSFGGVEHRCELVREYNGVTFYNSSIDSSPTRTAAALSNFNQKVIVICGGYDKKIPFEPLAKPLCSHAHTVVFTGATGPKILSVLQDSGLPLPRIIEEPEFDKAVLAAANAAEAGDIVLLSPACASFDAFPNFEVRGNRFKELVNQL